MRVILTYADYAAIPSDGRRYELHDGELWVTPAPSPDHQEVTGYLYAALLQRVRARALGKMFVAPIDCLLSDVTVVQPDIVFLDRTRLSSITRRGIEGPPTLVVEALSPSTERVDRGLKAELYARHGIPYYWIVDPAARAIEVYTLEGGAYQMTARLAGEHPAALPPFDDLPLDPAAIWA